MSAEIIPLRPERPIDPQALLADVAREHYRRMVARWSDSVLIAELVATDNPMLKEALLIELRAPVSCET